MCITSGIAIAAESIEVGVGIVEDVDVTLPTAELHRLTCVCHRAAAVPVTLCGAIDSGRIDEVIAMAFLDVLDTTETIAVFCAIALAELDCHDSIVGIDKLVQST